VFQNKREIFDCSIFLVLLIKRRAIDADIRQLTEELSNSQNREHKGRACRVYLGPCKVVSHFPQQQVIGGVLAAGLQFGGRLRSAKVLVAIPAGYYQELPAIDVVLLRFTRL